MLNQAVQQDSDNIVTVDDINCSAISVVQLSADFTAYGSAISLPTWTSTKRAALSKPNSPGCKLEFTDPFEPRVDAVIKVEYPNGEFLYAPLRRAESDDQSITVSFGSHLTLQRLFANFPSSIELAQALPCESTTAACETQFKAKARLLSFMAETTRLYEYTDGIVASDTALQALAKLEAKSDLITHIDTAVNEITRSLSPIAKGTLRDSYDTTANSSILNGVLQSRLQPTENYNSVFFAMGFSEVVTSSSNTENRLITSSSKISNDATGSPNPKLIHNAFYLDYRYDDILPNIPFESSSISFKNYDVLNPSLNKNRYSFLAGSGQSDNNQSLVNGTHLSSQGFFLNDRALNQTLTDTPTGVGDIGEGYDFNPVYYKLYRVNEYEPDTSLTNLDPPVSPDYGDSATWYTGAGYGLSNIYEIEQTAADPINYERRNAKEKQRYFSWEVHGLEADETIDNSDITGTYDVVAFTIQTQRTPDDAITLAAETLTWTANGSLITEDQAAGDSHYRTRTLARTSTNNIALTPDFIRTLSNLNYSLIETNTKKNGLLYLGSNANSDRPLGHVSNSGDHIAFAVGETTNNINTKSATRGLILANKQRAATPNLITGTPLEFTLSGNYFFMDADTHRLASINESILTMRVDPNGVQDCLSDLTITRTYVDHMLTGAQAQQILDPASETLSPIASTGCSLSGGKVQLDFTLAGKSLILRGFATPVSTGTTPEIKLMNLLWLQDDALGLVFAQADQNLSATFDN
jgi:hypothetical protein